MQEITIKTSGVITFWTNSASNRSKLLEALKAEGLERYAPPKKTISEAAKEVAIKASKDMGSSADAIFPLKGRAGFECVHITRGDKKNQYSQEFYFTIADNGINETGGKVYPAWRLNNMLIEEMLMVTGRAIGAGLVSAARDMEGVCLRKNGGLYRIPEEHVDAWRKLVAIFEEHSNTTVSAGRMEVTPSTIKVVCESFKADVQSAIDAIREDLAENNQRTSKYFKNRMLEALKMEAQAKHLEDELQVNLNDMATAITGLQSELATLAAVVA